jgi:Mrp family chromosome partitioning ATPase
VSWKESIHLPISLRKELVEVNRHAAGERSDAMNRHAHLMTPAGVGKAMQAKETNKVDHIIAVMSGKGGVGKSLVTGLAGIVLKRSGFEVGILDADITGPSIPVMFGINKRPEVSKTGLLPVMSSSGIAIMSINLMLEREDDPVIWRGPLIGNTIKQFWEDVLWGKLDYLLIDLPPGTSDAPLTVMQSLPLFGIVIVFTPQELASMVVRKAINMTRDSMHIPILGVVENMSYLTIPGTEKVIEIFGKSRAEEMARVAGAPLLGRFPIDPELARICDDGEIESYNSDALNSFADSLIKIIKGKIE